MITTKTVVVKECDRCKAEVKELHDFFGEQTSYTVCDHAEEFQLCHDCLSQFREFMANRPTLAVINDPKS